MCGPFIYRKYYYYYDLLCLRRTVITIIQLPVSVCVLQLATEICVRVVKRERDRDDCVECKRFSWFLSSLTVVQAIRI